ncbi:hypothetical protein [Streptomyces coffeae]|uniref:LexA repressor DNA-binding domain-containing protein n=1 Tax=Streptomyces coffeae TaxID=621382 RepID=A0ABS1NPK8_9ACTN|nr:hypothetical protein [Streptomyces coffeae]MBL1102017.1 hypothetical protein [Streptomyces coffeae]
MSLTVRQEVLARASRDWIAEHGEALSLRELAAAVGLASPSSVSYQLRRMRARGIDVKTRGRLRSQ